MNDTRRILLMIETREGLANPAPLRCLYKGCLHRKVLTNVRFVGELGRASFVFDAICRGGCRCRYDILIGLDTDHVVDLDKYDFALRWSNGRNWDVYLGKSRWAPF